MTRKMRMAIGRLRNIGKHAKAIGNWPERGDLQLLLLPTTNWRVPGRRELVAIPTPITGRCLPKKTDLISVCTERDETDICRAAVRPVSICWWRSL